MVRCLLAACLLALSGCAQSRPPQAPPKKTVKVETSDEEPRHVAPPPAYGNKVVLLD